MADIDSNYMRMALWEAKKGIGRTSPNPCVGAIVVKSGRVRISKKDSAGKERLLAYLEPDQYFGEIALLDSSPRSASVMADMNSTLLKLNSRDFNNLISGNQDMEVKFYRSFTNVLCERLRAANENLTFDQEVKRMINEIEMEGR